MLDINNLTKRYGGHIAVKDISLTIKQGELFSILGPSGSGKSSLLQCISGLELPQEGSISIHGEDVTQQPASERDTAMVFQNLALFPHMSVEENIEYGLKREGIKKSERESRIQEYLELVDLAGYNNRDIEQLSGGEQQRVALARSLVLQPDVLLLDEALGSLDQQLRVQLQDKLYEIQRELDQTMVYVTHDQNVAFSISDRVAVLNKGRLEQVSSPRTLYESPETPFMASFVGDSNSFSGVTKSTNNQEAEVVVPGSDSSFRGRKIDDGVREEVEVTVIVKINDVKIDTENDHENKFAGKVKNKKYLGQSSYISVEIADELVITATTEDPWGYKTGDTVDIGWAAEDCFIFKSES